MIIFWFKALHLIGMVTWFAGLFYLVRLFVYHAEANDKEEPERSILKKQYALMERRLFYIITWPGMVITVVCGVGMLVFHTNYLHHGWIHAKLGMVVLLIAYHFYCGKVLNDLKNDRLTMGSFGFRLMNEFPTILLVGIILLAVFRNMLDFAIAFGGLVLFGVLLFIAARLYKAAREKK